MNEFQKQEIKVAAENSSQQHGISEGSHKRHYEAVFTRGAQHVIEHPERYELFTKEYLIKHVNDVANEAAKVAIEIERKSQNNRKPLGIHETRALVNIMLAEEISFSRFVELINEGGVK